MGGRGGCLKWDVQVQGGGRILDIEGQGGVGLELWTIFMDVICVSSLINFNKSAKYDKLVKYLPYCTQHCAITTHCRLKYIKCLLASLRSCMRVLMGECEWNGQQMAGWPSS